MNDYENAAVQHGFKLHQDLGGCTAEVEDIGARINLEVNLTCFDMNNRCGHDLYKASVEFYRGRGDTKVPVVEAKFNAFDLSSVIRTLKRAEDGIEEFFRDELRSTYDRKSKRRVMQCIISLESQLKPIIADRAGQLAERIKQLK